MDQIPWYVYVAAYCLIGFLLSLVYAIRKGLAQADKQYNGLDEEEATMAVVWAIFWPVVALILYVIYPIATYIAAPAARKVIAFYSRVYLYGKWFGQPPEGSYPTSKEVSDKS